MQIRQDTYKKHYLFLVTLATGRAQRDVRVEKQNHVPATKSINNKNRKSDSTKINHVCRR